MVTLAVSRSMDLISELERDSRVSHVEVLTMTAGRVSYIEASTALDNDYGQSKS
jgi:hypothetical protein